MLRDRSKALLILYYIIGVPAYWIRAFLCILYLSRHLYFFLEDKERNEGKAEVFGEDEGVAAVALPSLWIALNISFNFFIIIIGKGLILPETLVNILLHWTASCANQACLCNIECCIWERLRRKMWVRRGDSNILKLSWQELLNRIPEQNSSLIVQTITFGMETTYLIIND